MAQLVGSLTSMRETQIDCQASDFGLAQPQLLWAFGKTIRSWEILSVSYFLLF